MLTINQMIVAVSNQTEPNNAEYLACLSQVAPDDLTTFLALSSAPIVRVSNL